MRGRIGFALATGSSVLAPNAVADDKEVLRSRIQDVQSLRDARKLLESRTSKQRIPSVVLPAKDGSGSDLIDSGYRR